MNKVDKKGIESEVICRLIDAFNLSFTVVVNDRSIQECHNPQVKQLIGIMDLGGRENSDSTKYCVATGVQYHGQLSNGGWYISADYSFKTGALADVSNTVPTPYLHSVNFRAGADFEQISIT